MMSAKTTQDNYECSKPECGSSEFMEISTVARIEIVMGTVITRKDERPEQRCLRSELLEEERFIWGFRCVACGTLADARLKEKLLSLVYK